MRKVLYTLCSGVLVLAAFYVPHAWPLVFVALVPFFNALYATRRTRDAVFLGTLLGAVISGGTSFWYFSSTPLVEGLTPTISLALVAAFWSVMVIALMPTVGLFALCAYAWPRTGISGFIAIPCAWVFGEFLRLYAFWLVTFSPGTENPPFYSVGFLGYPLADSSAWLQFAALGGVYFMSFAAVVTNYLLFRKNSTAWRLGILLVLALISCIPIADLRAHMARDQTYDTAHIGIMAVYLPEETLGPNYKLSREFKEEVSGAVAALSSQDPDIILLPEGGMFLTRGNSNESPSPLVIDVAASPVEVGRLENIAYAGTVEGARTASLRAKRIVTPQGEYLIGLTRLFAPLVGRTEEIERIGNRITISTASWGVPVAVPNSNLAASIMFCIEIISPGFGRTIVREQESDILLVPMSHGRFKNPYTLRVDTLRFQKVQAVEAARPLISSADHAPAYVLDAYGRVAHVAGQRGSTEYKIVSVSAPRHR